MSNVMSLSRSIAWPDFLDIWRDIQVITLVPSKAENPQTLREIL